jgi:hypothetical protein
MAGAEDAECSGGLSNPGRRASRSLNAKNCASSKGNWPAERPVRSVGRHSSGGIMGNDILLPLKMELLVASSA